MWGKLERPWQMAFEQGWEALKAGSIPIGAVIADESGNVISWGRNRIYEKSLRNPKIAHAEMEAIRDLDTFAHLNLRAYTLFTCMEPCPMCMGTIVMSNLRKLRIAARDGYCGAVHYCKYDPYIAAREMDIHFELGPLEVVQITLQAYFELKMQNGMMNRVASIFERDSPVAVRLAKLFYNNGFLEDAIDSEVECGVVFDHIIGRIGLTS